MTSKYGRSVIEQLGEYHFVHVRNIPEKDLLHYEKSLDITEYRGGEDEIEITMVNVIVSEHLLVEELRRLGLIPKGSFEDCVIALVQGIGSLRNLTFSADFITEDFSYADCGSALEHFFYKSFLGFEAYRLTEQRSFADLNFQKLN